MRGGGLLRPRPRGLGGNSNFLHNKPFTNPSRPIPVVTLDIALSKHDRSTQVCINLGFQGLFLVRLVVFSVTQTSTILLRCSVLHPIRVPSMPIPYPIPTHPRIASPAALIHRWFMTFLQRVNFTMQVSEIRSYRLSDDGNQVEIKYLQRWALKFNLVTFFSLER